MVLDEYLWTDVKSACSSLERSLVRYKVDTQTKPYMHGIGRVEVDPVRPWLSVGPAFDQIMTVCNMDKGVWT